MTQLASIGTATMRPDGTIVMMLRAQTDDVIGDACLEIAPSDPRYQDTLAHLGGITPGEQKPVPPWPD